MPAALASAVCRKIAEEQGIVIIADRNEQKNNALLTELKRSGGNAHAVQLELTDEEACKTLIDTVVQRYGRIDGLVNNAGLNDGVSLAQGTVIQFEQSLRINLIHYYAMAHYALPHLKAGKGSIVNVGSKVSVTGQGSTSGYAASKGGVNALTREWAAELLPYGIRVNAVLPAEVDTPLYKTWLDAQPDGEEKRAQIESRIPLGHRFTTADEIASTVVFLLSTLSSHTTGQLLFVDGGYTHLDRALT